MILVILLSNCKKNVLNYNLNDNRQFFHLVLTEKNYLYIMI